MSEVVGGETELRSSLSATQNGGDVIDHLRGVCEAVIQEVSENIKPSRALSKVTCVRNVTLKSGLELLGPCPVS